MVEGDLDSDWTQLLVGCVVASTIAISMLIQHGWHMQSRLTLSVWCGLTALIFEKPTTMTSADMSNFTQGELVNFISADAQVTPYCFNFRARVTLSRPVTLVIPQAANYSG